MNNDNDLMDYLHEQGFTHIHRTPEGVVLAYDMWEEVTLAITAIYHNKEPKDTLQ